MWLSTLRWRHDPAIARKKLSAVEGVDSSESRRAHDNSAEAGIQRGGKGLGKTSAMLPLARMRVMPIGLWRAF